MKPRVRLTLEQLEVRETPAVDVLVTGGTGGATITLTGTDDSEQVLINFMPGSASLIHIFGLAGTSLSLNPGSSYTGGTVSQVGFYISISPFPSSFDLTINLAGGDDNVTLVHTVPFTPLQIGTLSVDLGAGNDVFLLQGQGVYNTRVNTLTFDAGVGDDKVEFSATQVGDVSGVCQLGDGHDTIRLSGAGTRINGPSAPWQLDLGKGRDTAEFLDTSFGATFVTSTFTSILNGGGLVVAGGGGRDSVVFGGSGAMLGVNGNFAYNLICNQLSIDLGKGKDRLIVSAPNNGSHTCLFYARNNTGSNAQIIMGPTSGDSNDRIIFGDGTGTGQSVKFGVFSGVAADLDISMGSGDDRIFIRNAVFNLLDVLMEDGDDRVDNNWGSDGVTVNTTGSVLNGGAHLSGDLLPTGFTAPANLNVTGFNP